MTRRARRSVMPLAGPVGYLLAVLAVVPMYYGMAVIKLFTDGKHSPFVLVFAVVILVTRFAGLGQGLLAAFAATAVCDYFFIPPVGAFFFQGMSVSEAAEIAVVLVESLVICGLTYSLLQALIQEKVSAEQLLSAKMDADAAKLQADGAKVEADAAKMEADAARAEADAANQAKSHFLANMSHEIRTPLGAVLGFAELAVDPTNTAADRACYLDAIRRNGSMLTGVINDILDLSKVEAGKVEVQREDTSLSQVLTDISTFLSLQASAKGVVLTINTVGTVPDIVSTDPLRLRQILLNIVGNAIKFTKKGSVGVEVKQLIGSNSSLGNLAFAVKDSGCGISSEQAKRLFVPFSQADFSTSKAFGGTGLGLVLSRRLAQLLGGDLVLSESQYGVGSTFTITIDPGAVKAAPADQSPPAPAVSSHAEAQLHGMHVLLADDSPDNRLLLERILQAAGVHVDTAENGSEALRKIDVGKYHAVLMDVQMPVMDGLEATKRLRQSGCRTPVIALTAYALSEERQRCLDAGFNDHIAKPIDRAALLRSLANYRP